MKKQMVLISFFLFVTLPAAGIAAEKASQPGTGDQRAACDAGCRENYQNNSAALQACLRDCGAVGPASPAGAMAPGHELTHTTQQAGGAAAPAAQMKTSNLNPSKSNINGEAEPAGTGAQPAATAKGKPSKEQSPADLQAAPDTGETPAVEPVDDAPADG